MTQRPLGSFAYIRLKNPLLFLSKLNLFRRPSIDFQMCTIFRKHTVYFIKSTIGLSFPLSSDRIQLRTCLSKMLVEFKYFLIVGPFKYWSNEVKFVTYIYSKKRKHGNPDSVGQDTGQLSGVSDFTFTRRDLITKPVCLKFLIKAVVWPLMLMIIAVQFKNPKKVPKKHFWYDLIANTKLFFYRKLSYLKSSISLLRKYEILECECQLRSTS